MERRPTLLHNGHAFELWPAWLLRAHRNADARVLALARWVLRDKASGRYVAAISSHRHITSLPPIKRPLRFADELFALLRSTESSASETLRPLRNLSVRLQVLGLDVDAYSTRSALQPVAEPATLNFAGFDRYHRSLWLTRVTSIAWGHMQAAAREDGVVLEAISGYRSHDYQLGIFARKRARGLSVEEILAVNAAPGFSEHHSGEALDIGTPGELPAEESFEHTEAFHWLQHHAAEHGFHMSYPRDNPHGIVYEPWHWRWRATG